MKAPREKTPPSLKSTSGAGFTFEDKAAAVLLCEMLTGDHSFGPAFGVIQKLERQAGDWEPFGDLLLEIPDSTGKLIRLAGSVKSNRLINANGCNAGLCAAMWSTMAKPVFAVEDDRLLLVSAPLTQAVSVHLSNLCRQAKSTDADRLDQKIVHTRIRTIYDSFRKADDVTAKGLPGNILARLLHREFDFEAAVSQAEVAALRLCREALHPEKQSEEAATDLWKRLCEIAQELRISGGVITRGGVSAKLRHKFPLRDDPCDASGWTMIRAFSNEAIEEIETTLTGGINLPRIAERTALQAAVSELRGCHVLGDSGSGKSALVKEYAISTQKEGAEIVWIKAERFSALNSSVSGLLRILQSCRKASALLVVDALEGSSKPELFSSLARLISSIMSFEGSPWSVILVCQTPDWARVYLGLNKHLAGSAVLTKRVECGPLAKQDFDLVCATSSTVAKLAREPNLRRFLSTPKMLDVLMAGQLSENRAIAGEADLVEWWWERQVCGYNVIGTKERVARELAVRMADELRSELSPDSVAGVESAAEELIRNRVLKRTRDGLLRFEHDLLADWSRVMHLKGLGQDKLDFIKTHAENPPWIRAVRLLSQHLLDRVTDLNAWRGLLNDCKLEAGPHDELPAANLQVIDAWLEGVIFSSNPARVLVEITDDLFNNNGWLLRRLIRRLMLVATFPDPVIQERCAKIDAETAEIAAARYRLPMWWLWLPVVKFLTSHPQQTTDMAAVTLGEIAEMWARLEDYVQCEWTGLAELVTLNAEKELRRESEGVYRYDAGPRPLGGANNARKNIYRGALFAAKQLPERGAKLLLKAAGIAEWENGDISRGARGEWRGEWRASRNKHLRDSYVEMPPKAWPGGPTRKTSSNFFQAWFDSAASIRLFKCSPSIACDATMGFLLDWPKRIIPPGEHHGIGSDRYGFTSDADEMYPPFYHKGPFLAFLRENWEPALQLIVRMTNFATERYADRCPNDSKPIYLTFRTKDGEASWLGKHQVFGWSRYHWHTPQVITCALMALEKWLEEEIEKKESIAHPIQFLYRQGCSQAFAGLLIALGKRHPELFLDELKPLLFVRDFYLHDLVDVNGGNFGGWAWPRDGAFINNLRREWEALPGRRTKLIDLTCQWFVRRVEFQTVFHEVALAWRREATALPEGSEGKLPLLRWAAKFDLSNWREVTFSDGSKGWQYEQPEELRDVEGMVAHTRRQALLTLPYQCSEFLEKRPSLSHEQFESIWNQLHDWSAFEKAEDQIDDDGAFSPSFRDHRHARAGLIAVLFCLGGDWLDCEDSRRVWMEEELRKLLADPPKVHSLSADDLHDDCEGFLARSVVQCWVHSPDSQEWRGAAGSFVTAFRYRTVQKLFEEAFRHRSNLRNGFRDLEGLLLSFSAVKQKARIDGIEPQPKLIGEWITRWLPKFKGGFGPEWANSWMTVEIQEPFPPEHISEHAPLGPKRRSRRDYGLDMHALLAAFGTLPTLNKSENADEREHWFGICREMLSAYLRTLPIEGGNDDEEWDYALWKADKEIQRIVAGRILECSSEEQRTLWAPILDLPPAAHHHITNFLSELLIATIRSDSPRIAELIPVWRAMIKHLFASPKWNGKLRHRAKEVWKYLFLYGGSVSSVRDKDHIPLVAAMRDLFERHVKMIGQDPYDQSAFATFVLSDAGEQLLVHAFEWLNLDWQKASQYYWKKIAEQGHLEELLQRAWRKHFSGIRQNPDALKAFKTLTLNLAAQQVSTAIEIQKQLA